MRRRAPPLPWAVCATPAPSACTGPHAVQAAHGLSLAHRDAHRLGDDVALADAQRRLLALAVAGAVAVVVAVAVAVWHAVDDDFRVAEPLGVWLGKLHCVALAVALPDRVADAERHAVARAI